MAKTKFDHKGMREESTWNSLVRELVQLRAKNKKLRALVPKDKIYREIPEQLELDL